MPARAKLPPGSGKRVPLNMRTTQELRGRLEKEASKSGRSLVQEVEYRVDRSFIEDDGQKAVFGDERTQALLRLLNVIKDMIEGETGKNAFDDYETSIAVHAAMIRILDGFLIAPEPPNLKKAKRKYQKARAEHDSKYPHNTLAALAGIGQRPEPPKELTEAADRAKLLGESLSDEFIKAFDKSVAAGKKGRPQKVAPKEN